jgi:hypothetical protein
MPRRLTGLLIGNVLMAAIVTLGVLTPQWSRADDKPGADKKPTTKDKARLNDKPAIDKPASDKTGKSLKERSKDATSQKPTDKSSVAPTKSNAPTKNNSSAKANVVRISPEHEAAALAFAGENHPELASLLDGLKQNAPKEYQAALVDLHRTVERLANVKERSLERHEFVLAEWKLSSRIRLLAARLTMSSDPAVEAELRAALRERVEFRLAAQRTERDRLQTRVGKLEEQIEETASTADAIVEKQFLELRKSLPDRPAARAKSKKAAARAAETKVE